jgi:hypothetical protein
VPSIGQRRAIAISGAFVALTAAIWLSSGATPLIRAVMRAPAPNDFTPDYVAAYAWLHDGPRGPGAAAVLDGPAGNVYGASIGAPPVYLLAAYYVHPPTAFLMLMPLVPLGYRNAALGWLLASIAALAVLAAFLRAAAGWEKRGPSLPVIFVLLLLWPAVLTNIQLGQSSIFLAAMIAAGHAAWAAGRQRRGAAWIGTAVALKLTPVLLVPFLALRDRRATLVLLGTLAGFATLSLAAGQLVAWQALFRHSAENVAIWQAYRDNTLSFGGLWARLFIGGRFATPLWTSPMLARMVGLGCVAALACVALWLTRPRLASAPDRANDGCAFALWNVLMVVANPLAWAHYAILLLLPMALVLKAAERADAAPARRMRLLTAVAFLTCTIPKETLYRLAGAGPVGPGRGLFLSIPLAGALLLFVAAALGLLTRSPRPEA